MGRDEELNMRLGGSAEGAVQKSSNASIHLKRSFHFSMTLGILHYLQGKVIHDK